MITGLVLAGGFSRRLGQEKALMPVPAALALANSQKQPGETAPHSAEIKPATTPAFIYSLQILEPHCDQLFVGCRKSQTQKLYAVMESHPGKMPAAFCPDLTAYENNGPIGSLLSLLSLLQNPLLCPINESPKNHVILIGCDYPLITSEAIQQLVAQGLKNQSSCCFQHPESQILEPLVAFYHDKDLAKLSEFFASSNSLNRFLSQCNPHILSGNSQILRSFDTLSDWQSLQ